ncbi:MAG: zinc ABC transporter ATP-binding protein ZnuC [Magnetococcales bacterium]|nr:zinc ABC transporter ATP-binding protein ZnuC [Magnetococcales bacterium]
MPVKTKKPKPLVSAKGVYLSFGKKAVLINTNVKVRPNEIVTLIGPNGAGKSTLIKVLLGLVKPDRGVIKRQPGLSIGYVPQKLTLDETLPLPVHRLMTLTQKAKHPDIIQALKETNVDGLIDAPVHTLSGGELQRVMIARALLRKPDLMVLDEPTQGVDISGEAALYALIGTIRDRYGCGVLMISHDLHVVMGTTDRVIGLDRKVCCKGKPAKVLNHPEYTRLFGPQAAQHLAIYTHQHSTHHHHHHDGDICQHHDDGACRNPNHLSEALPDDHG